MYSKFGLESANLVQLFEADNVQGSGYKPQSIVLMDKSTGLLYNALIGEGHSGGHYSATVLACKRISSAELIRLAKSAGERVFEKYQGLTAENWREYL